MLPYVIFLKSLDPDLRDFSKKLEILGILCWGENLKSRLGGAGIEDFPGDDVA